MLLPAMLGLLLLMQAQPAPVGTASISGQVVNAVTGAAVPRAQIELGGHSAKGYLTRYATADAQGRFGFAGLLAGEYFLAGSANQFVRTVYGARKHSPPEMIKLGDAEDMKGIVFRLKSQGVVTGTVLDENGDPVPNASIRCFQVYYRGGRRQLGPAGGANSNDLGEYRAYGLVPGKYYFEITAPPKQNTSAGGKLRTISYGITYYPDVQDLAHAIAVEITAGEQLRLNFHLSLVTTYKISGKLGLPEGFPQNGGIGLWLYSVEAASAPPVGVSSIDSKTGGFQLSGVPPGSYVLIARADAQTRTGAVTGQQNVEVLDSDVGGVHVDLSAPVDVIAKAQVETGGGPYSLMLDRADRLNSFEGSPQPDGSIEFSNVTPGKYTLRLNGGDDLYLKSARIGDTDVLKDGLIISPGASPGTLDLVIAKATGEIDGSVTTADKPTVKADVNLMETSQDGVPFVYKSAESDALGDYSMKGVPPGDYRMVAFPHATYVDQLEAAEFNEAMRDSMPVHMDDHGHKQLDLKTVELPDE